MSECKLARLDQFIEEAEKELGWRLRSGIRTSHNLLYVFTNAFSICWHAYGSKIQNSWGDPPRSHR
ncbi:hypothetical protein DL98DRAFT_521414 [Cadophora sp. DSE1049]|nr:hypothetical protein DL98DRAFT_521414 [Cadophora sp. DSE1049]